MFKLRFVYCSTLLLCLTFTLDAEAHECSEDEECQDLKKCDEYKYIIRHEYEKLPKVCGILRNTMDHCCKIKPEVKLIKRLNIEPSRINAPKCGTFTISPKIVGGSIANIEQFPWMALLQYTSALDENDVKYLCGGSLISTRYVLTAAHCTEVKDFKLVKVRLGEHTISKNRDCDDYEDEDSCSDDPVQDISVEEIIKHPSYQAVDKPNDIALLRLIHDAKIAANVRTVCLPVEEEHSVIENLEDIEITKMIIAGWGRTENGRTSDVLLYAGVRYLKHEECRSRFDDIMSRHSLFKFNFTEFHLCAGGDQHVDACRGDSGAPIIYPAKMFNKYRMFQYGVVAAGSRLCSTVEPIPGIYTRITSYIDWISENIKD